MEKNNLQTLEEKSRYLENIEVGSLVYISYGKTQRRGSILGVVGHFQEYLGIESKPHPDTGTLGAYIFLRKGRFVIKDDFLDAGTLCCGGMMIASDDEVFIGEKEVMDALAKKFARTSNPRIKFFESMRYDLT